MRHLVCVSVLLCLRFQAVLRLNTRKNGITGSVLLRACWCKQCTKTCPVHVLWKYFVPMPVGSSPFAWTDGKHANDVLRACCAAVKEKKASSFRCHDFRRGHTEDMKAAGATLKQILDAGQWSSPRFLAYIDVNTLERDVVVSAHLDESDDED